MAKMKHDQANRRAKVQRNGHEFQESAAEIVAREYIHQFYEGNMGHRATAGRPATRPDNKSRYTLIRRNA